MRPGFENIAKFLDRQKKRMLMLDGASEESGWRTPDEQSGEQFVATVGDRHPEAERRGRPIGMHEMLYDNAIAWLLYASSKVSLIRQECEELKDNDRVIKEDTTSADDIATFTTALLPAIRRIYANLIAMDLVSVQPLAGPTGLLYWIDHLYTEAHEDEQVAAGDRLDQYQGVSAAFDSAEADTIYQIDAQLRSKTITAETKKVATRWTAEAEQDLFAQWKLNLEAELMPELGNSIVREINRKLLAALMAGAKNNVDWSKSPLVKDETSADKLAYYQTLWHSIQMANTKIIGEKYQPATYLVMNHNTYYYLERLNNFKADPNMGQAAITHTRFVGTLSGLYKVYVDPHFYDNKILLGYRGASWKDAVAYYCPYVPLFLSDRYIYNNDFTQIMRGAMTRYAYGVIPETSTQDPIKNGGLATVTLTT